MKNFCEPHGLYVDWASENHRLGVVLTEISRFSSGEQHIDKNGNLYVRKRTKVGRPTQPRVACKFCGKDFESEGNMRDHFNKSHKKEGSMSHLPRNTNKEYSCPVAGCKAAIGNFRKKLANHLKDENAHTIAELLDCGVHAWHHRKSSLENARELVRWLQNKDLIDVKDSRKRD